MAHDGSNVGGVGIYVRNCYSCNLLKYFCIPTTDNIKVEDLWFEIQHGTKNMLLVVYIDIQINTVLQIFVNTWTLFWEKYQNQRPHVSLLVTVMDVSRHVGLWGHA